MDSWPRWQGPVVVGVDGSTAALRAVVWAAVDARRQGADLRIVHAVGATEFFPGGAMSPSTELYGLLEQESKVLLRDAEQTAAEAAPGLTVSTASTTEPAVLALIGESNTARSVVLGGSGRGAFAGLLLGSTTVALAAHAHCPVVAVRGPGERAADAPVVVGVDGSELSDLALGCAFDQASRRGVRLIAVHAFTDADPHQVFRSERMEHDWEPQDITEQRVLERWLGSWAERYPDVEIEEDLVQAKPRQRLLERSSQACVLVVGSRGRGGFTGLLVGSTSQAMLHHAECPVMVVRPEPD
jgi:nucleotide-binding universal stress UspA family protein